MRIRPIFDSIIRSKSHAGSAYVFESNGFESAKPGIRTRSRRPVPPRRFSSSGSADLSGTIVVLTRPGLHDWRAAQTDLVRAVSIAGGSGVYQDTGFDYPGGDAPFGNASRTGGMNSGGRTMRGVRRGTPWVDCCLSTTIRT